MAGARCDPYVGWEIDPRLSATKTAPLHKPAAAASRGVEEGQNGRMNPTLPKGDDHGRNAACHQIHSSLPHHMCTSAGFLQTHTKIGSGHKHAGPSCSRARHTLNSGHGATFCSAPGVAGTSDSIRVATRNTMKLAYGRYQECQETFQGKIRGFLSYKSSCWRKLRPHRKDSVCCLFILSA